MKISKTVTLVLEEGERQQAIELLEHARIELESLYAQADGNEKLRLQQQQEFLRKLFDAL